MVLRAGLSNAVREELVSKNVAALVKVSKPRKSRKVKPWSVDEARHFLENARAAGDPLYAAYVLILVLGLRKGEVLGLTWDLVNLDEGELFVMEQLQRVGDRLLRRETKTEPRTRRCPCQVSAWQLSNSGILSKTGIGKLARQGNGPGRSPA